MNSNAIIVTTWLKKYGTKLQAISGIHYNMELGKDLVEALFKESNQTDMIAFKERPLS